MGGIGIVGGVGRVGCVVLLGALALLADAAAASAQVRRIRGQVVDEQGQAVPGAVVEAAIVALADVEFSVRRTDQTWRALTNANGEYIVAVPQAGEYIVAATKDGLGSDRTKVAVRTGLVTANLTLWKTSAATVAATNCGTRQSDGALNTTALAAGAEAGLARFMEWLEGVHLHAPGCTDAPAIDVSRWPVHHLVTLLRDVRELTAFLHRAEDQRLDNAGRGSAQGSQLTFLLYGRRFTLDQLERGFFGGQPINANDLLRRGALLHADIGVFVPGNLNRHPLVQDGGQRGWRGGSSHWEAGRELLDSIAPAASADSGALLWYRAISAHLFRTGNLAELTTHLRRAREVFPQSADVLLDSAYLHLELSSPSIQVSVQQLRADAVNVAVGSGRVELQRAERFLREVLVLAGGNADAHLRLGHTLGALGNHKEAAVELRRAITATPDRRRLYLAQLFLGREEEALGRHDEARRCYEQAAKLFPDAQSPQLALSGLARRIGDRASAQRSLLSLASISSVDSRDPWWEFYRPHEHDAEDLMLRMRQIGSAK